MVAAETSCTAFGSDLTSFCEKRKRNDENVRRSRLILIVTVGL